VQMGMHGGFARCFVIMDVFGETVELVFGETVVVLSIATGTWRC
jgi:hypothetical protein